MTWPSSTLSFSQDGFLSLTPEPYASGLWWPYHLAYTNGSADKMSLGPPLLDSPEPGDYAE